MQIPKQTGIAENLQKSKQRNQNVNHEIISCFKNHHISPNAFLSHLKLKFYES
jgi:hypothetical protein